MQPGMRMMKAGAIYFLVVFCAGFALGPIRIQWLAPRFGERAAELMEMPVMLIVIVAAARWVVRRFILLPGRKELLGTGVLALVLMLTAEFSLVILLRGLTLREYFATRDPVSGTVYYLMLALFAIMPALVRR